jgi:hypothetical protein
MIICRTCRAAPAAPNSNECLECWVAHPVNTERAMEKIRAGVPFRQAKIEALAESRAERAL